MRQKEGQLAVFAGHDGDVEYTVYFYEAENPGEFNMKRSMVCQDMFK